MSASTHESGDIADDLFAGAGGWDLGAAALGIHARGVEIMREALATRAVAGLSTIHNDVWTFWPDGRATGKIASPPCPTFSLSGKGTGRRALDSVLCAIDDGAYRDLDQLREYPVSDDDDRTRLVLTPLHFATQHEYEWLAWEQVPAVLPVWEACAEVLRAEGWHVWTGKVYSEQFGVPQTRTRAVLIASRRHPVSAPVPTHSRYHARNPTHLDPGVASWVSMAEGIGWGLQERPSPTITGGGTETGGAEPIAKIVDRWTTRPDWCYRRPSTVVQADPRIAAPGHRCMTVYCHPGRQPESMMANAVRVTVSEAGILQSFPADYPWQGAKGKQFLQAGNAVPPRMAMQILAVAAGVALDVKGAVA